MISRYKLLVLAASVSAASSAMAASDDVLTFGGSVQQYWDSNFSQSPAEDSEHYLVESALVSIKKELSRQNLSARWIGKNYDYDVRSDLDATTNEGDVAWVGHFGSRLQTHLEWSRDARPVEQLEFTGKDIVNRDMLAGDVSYGTGNHLTFKLGGVQAKQNHSNDERAELEFEDESGFVELGYKTGLKSTILLRYMYGEVVYPNGGEDVTPNELDYDYYQTELEGNWVASEKTNVSMVLGYFSRKGEINDGTGFVSRIALNWAMSPKVQLEGGYQYREPAVGETSDSPAQTQLVFLHADWQWTSKITYGARASYSKLNYENFSPGPERDEDISSVTPLYLSYAFSEAFSIRMNASWEDRQSPLDYRDYETAKADIGLFAHF